MNGIILINKDYNLTSRDVVNYVSKKLNIKKVGHAGTLDPIATGLLIIGVGKATKILDLLTLDKKEYIATVKMGIQTDTFDITGNITKKLDDYEINEKQIIEVLNTFIGSYLQEVPKYSAVKVNGKKLYEYARKNEKVDIPQRLVNIYELELLDFDYEKKIFKFKTLVSKGTYIRSLINDIGNKLNIPCTMMELVRTKSGKFDIKDSIKMDSEYKFIPIEDCLDYKKILIKDNDLLKKIKNGNKIELNENDKYILLINDNKVIAIYEKYDINKYKIFKMIEC